MKFLLYNILWLGVTALLYYDLRPLRKPLVLSVLATIAWRIHEIAPHRPSWSWLPEWWIGLEAGRLFDGYHLTGGLYGVLMLVSGYYAGRAIKIPHPRRWSWKFIGLIAFMVFYFGVTANLWYHVNFMLPEFREFDMIFHFWNVER